MIPLPHYPCRFYRRGFQQISLALSGEIDASSCSVFKKGREKNREEHSGLFKGKVKSSILHRVMTPLLNPSAMPLIRSALLLTPALPFSLLSGLLSPAVSPSVPILSNVSSAISETFANISWTPGGGHAHFYVAYMKNRKLFCSLLPSPLFGRCR